MSRGEQDAERRFEELLREAEDGRDGGLDRLIDMEPAHLRSQLRALAEAHRQAERELGPGPADSGPTGDGGTASLFFKDAERRRATPEPGLGPGVVAGDFELVALLGEGGMGQVWEARQLSLGGRKVALKFVRPERASAGALERFQREARAGGRLQHPGIVRVYGYGEEGGLAWIAMEQVQGGWTLRDSIDEIAKRHEVPAGYDREVARLVAAIADAVQAAHDANVIHRDLKPQNVLIGPDEQPRVTDFGLAKIVDETGQSQTGDLLGTYFYMSPEQVAAKRMDIDHRTDVFSLGVVLYEMLALQRPFQGDTSHQVAAQIVTKDPPDPRTVRSRIPRDLVVIAGKALEKDRDRRYPTMAEMAADLRRFLRDDPILARPPGRMRKIRLWTRRNPTKSVAGLVAAVAFLAISLLLGENVRARGKVESKNAELDAEIESVKRLSALQDLEDLIAEADDPERMWPAHPDRIDRFRNWIERGRELVDELPLHRRTRDELRARALPRTEEQRRRERETHPRYRELQLLEGELVWARHLLARRRDGVEVGLPDVSRGGYPDDPRRLLARAKPLVATDREEYGQEPLALALLQRALDLVGEDDDTARAAILAAASRAAFALGRDEDAINAAFEAVQAAPDEERERYESALEALDAEVGRALEGQALAELETRVAALQEQRDRLDAFVDERRDWQFSKRQSEARWWNNQLTKLIAGLEALADEETGLLGEAAVSAEHGWSVPRRLRLAQDLEAAFAEGGEYDARWKAALPEIAEAYPGLDLGVQMGLVPIGPNGRSGLWEFWHVQSGVEPTCDEGGKLQMTEETGMVLVLLRRGRFLMGAQRHDPGAPNHDAETSESEGPVHEVELSAFFLSKYEMTQGQWERVTGGNPSRWSPGGELSEVTLRHPVESVDWDRARAVLRRLGLDLPSEAQWEYGCRAGTSTPFSCPREELAAHANLADQSYKRIFRATVQSEAWSDGFAGPAPVGSLAPNAWGLHDLHGNVWEWCLDGYEADFYGHSPPLDPIAPWQGAATRVPRGGGFNSPVGFARSATRYYNPPSFADDILGVRAVRLIP